MKRFIVFAAIAALAPYATAQQHPRPRAADPAAPAPAVKHESAFSGYRSYRDEPLAPWREVNDEVTRAGGHIGILRGAGSVGGPAHGASQK